ncbi:hypothetical protein BDR04DRAFT_1145124 [Suillus decipiens]|nr:hypothetical protein BDR04DRAFT_1145124 [Suillus decipiens]
MGTSQPDSPAARGMSSPHQQECLDYQMNDSNFCKMIRMKRTLCRKYKLAKNGIAESGRAFDRLDEAAPSHLKTEWLAQERVAQSSRIRDPAEMDLYDINIKKGQIDGFTWSALTHLGEGFDADEDPDDFNIDILDDLKDDPADFTKISDVWTNTPELTIIPLPSNLGVDQCRLCMADDLILLEMSLREGQANDALHNLRIHLCNKAILFRTTVTSVQQAVSLHASIYMRTRKQMIRLEPGQDQLQKYKPLHSLPLAIQMPEASEMSPLPGSGPSKLTWGVRTTHGMRNEEIELVQLEMNWTCNFFLWKAGQWGDQMQESLVKDLPGHACYSRRQSHMYSLLVQDAQAAFQALQTVSMDADGIVQCHNPASTMSVSAASTTHTETSGNHYQPLTLDMADISCTLEMAASRICACISQCQNEAANSNVPSAAWITHFKAGLQWEISTFVTPLLQYSAARHIISVVPTPVTHILALFPMLTWNTVPDDIFSSHLCQFDDAAVLGHPSQIVSDYHAPWWIGDNTIPNQPWQWNQIMAACVFHYQHWESGIEDDGLVLPEQVDYTSVPSLMGLRWIRECLVALHEEQSQGIHEKMAEVKVYTEMLEKLKRGRGE